MIDIRIYNGFLVIKESEDMCALSCKDIAFIEAIGDKTLIYRRGVPTPCITLKRQALTNEEIDILLSRIRKHKEE